LSVLALVMLAATPSFLEAGPRFPRGLRAMELPPVPRGLKDWSQARCVKCHEPDAELWQHSGHAAARTNFVFQAALRFDEPTWCVRCHAPLARRADRSVPAADAPAEETGITCATCHASERGVLASRESPKSPHAIEVDLRLHSGELCAACHQFGFAVRDAHGHLARLSAVSPQQDTWSEWKRSGETRTCVDCHMKDHAFGGVRRFDALKAAITVREVDGALELSTRDMGHPFPTGDIMRWLTLELGSDPFFEQPFVAAKWGRDLGQQKWSDGDTYLGVVSEHRLQGPERVGLPSSTKWVAWRLVVHLVSPEQEMKGLLPPQASRVIINAGLLSNGRNP
jgi:hypothetical protein